MWKSVTRPASSVVNILNSEALQTQQIRTVFIFKRRYEVPLHKKSEKTKFLKPKHYIYDMVKDTTLDKQPNLDVILTAFVDGLGNAGDKISVSQHYGYINLILPRLAVYATPENLEKYKDIIKREDIVKYSSPSAKMMVDSLEKLTLGVVLSKETPWILKPWHVRVAFRRYGIILPEEAIALPEKEIKGPNMEFENKEFYVTVTINNTEKVNVRCRIHHWSRDSADRLPEVPEFWKIRSECIYPEFASILDKLPSTAVEKIKTEENL